MTENFKLEIISPDRTVIKTETTEVIIPSYEGQRGILKDHIPLVTFLRPGIINIKTTLREENFFIEDGIVEFSNNLLLILSSTVRNVKEISNNHIETMISEINEKNKDQKINDKERYMLSYKLETLQNISQ
jgi:F-type H+-transporting ATPase subunit epsilon|tara:strand:+ start:214 stop:606 length:393 start_codon:yes stop_codon:yes gene_type:complete